MYASGLESGGLGTEMESPIEAVLGGCCLPLPLSAEDMIAEAMGAWMLAAEIIASRLLGAAESAIPKKEKLAKLLEAV